MFFKILKNTHEASLQAYLIWSSCGVPPPVFGVWPFFVSCQVFVFVVTEFFSVEVLKAGVGLFEFTGGEPEPGFFVDDAVNVFPGAFKGYLCAVDGDYREEVFADGLCDYGFDLFFGLFRGLAVYPVADALFEGF